MSPEMARHFSPTRHGIPILAVVMISFAGWSMAAKHSSFLQTSPPIAAPTNPYDDNVAGTGIVEPASEVIALAVERGGVVTRVEVMAGDRVKAGQPLFAIDDRDYRAVVAEDEEGVAAADASINAIDQSLVQQRNTIDQARAALDSAEAERLRASLDQTRYAELARDSWATRQRLETASADAQKAGASVAVAKAALAGARQQIEVLSAQRKEAEAKSGQARATLGNARIDLDKTVVKAPIDGAVLKVNVRLGEYAQAGVLADPLMTMGSVDPLHVRVDIDETETWRVQPGRLALARLRRQPGNLCAAHLRPLRALRAAETVADGRYDRAGGQKSSAGDLQIRPRRVSGLCRPAGRRVYRSAEPRRSDPQPDFRSSRLHPGRGNPGANGWRSKPYGPPVRRSCTLEPPPSHRQ